MNRSQRNASPADGRGLHLDPVLIIRASLKATGADIHDVSNLISKYTGWYEILVGAESPDEIAEARARLDAAEASLRKFVEGMSAKQALAESQRRLRMPAARQNSRSGLAKDSSRR